MLSQNKHEISVCAEETRCGGRELCIFPGSLSLSHLPMVEEQKEAGVTTRQQGSAVTHSKPGALVLHVPEANRTGSLPGGILGPVCSERAEVSWAEAFYSPHCPAEMKHQVLGR